MNRKTALSSAIALALGGASLSASALITTSTNINIDSGAKNVACVIGGTPPNSCLYGVTTATFTGSWFSMDTDGNGTIVASEITAITSVGSIHAGVSNTATGSHAGTINGSESPAFSIWEFFGNTGMDYSDVPITVVTDNGVSKDLDFSGWSVTWAGIPKINMGGGTQDCGTATDGICVDAFNNDIAGTYDNGSGLATMVCSQSSCSTSSTYVLDYAAVVPQADPSNFGGVAYGLHLEGDIHPLAAVPVPAAAWLFGSGLVGLVGVARRKKASA